MFLVKIKNKFTVQLYNSWVWDYVWRKENPFIVFNLGFIMITWKKSDK